MKKYKILIFLIACFSVLNLAGCSTSQPNPSASPSATVSLIPSATSAPLSSPVTVAMTNFKFNPSEIIINKGETITWINNDSAIHNVVGDAFKSGNIAKGQQFSYTFNETGTFSYVCTYHPGMTGKVTVK